MDFVVVLGAGIMGQGIAETFAKSGYRVFLNDVNKEYVENALINIEKSIQKQIAKQKITEEESKDILKNIIPTENLSDYKNASLVIEAVSENIDIKKTVFKNLDKVFNKDTILASNTSTLSITEIASSTERPDKIIGMHFFIPAPVMKLVEIIPGELTSKDTISFVKNISEKINKITVQGKDYPGFIVNRIFIPMWNEAMFLVMEGVEPKDIDNAMKYGANLPMGPLELADFAGLDTVLSVMKTLYTGFSDPKFRPCPLLINKVAAGKLGRKTGEGFYKYN